MKFSTLIILGLIATIGYLIHINPPLNIPKENENINKPIVNSLASNSNQFQNYDYQHKTLTQQSAQEYSKQETNQAVDPLVPPANDPNHHSMNEMINDINSHSL